MPHARYAFGGQALRCPALQAPLGYGSWYLSALAAAAHAVLCRMRGALVLDEHLLRTQVFLGEWQLGACQLVLDQQISRSSRGA